MLDEVLAALSPRPDGFYVDATFGRGGHARAILARLSEKGALLAMDRDPDAVAAARAALGSDPRVAIVHAPFSRLGEALDACPRQADGILLDLGVSSPQLDDAARGFSFLRDGPLDMRMDPGAGESAAAWLARAGERDIARAVAELGEDRFARRIARAIVAARTEAPIVTTGRLAEIVSEAVPTREPGKHPATRTFQALRMLVNRELDELDAALPQAARHLAPGGRLAVISFHSLEDRRVKRFIRRESQDHPAWAGLPQVPPEARARLSPVGKAAFPSEQECARNPRARSAVLRVAERRAA
jgi:16S rRNA (cytosine1402-N4)-methyltransferase